MTPADIRLALTPPCRDCGERPSSSHGVWHVPGCSYEMPWNSRHMVEHAVLFPVRHLRLVRD